MTGKPDDPWRLPALQAFGSELGGLEQRGRQAPKRAGPRRILVAGACVALVACVFASVLALKSGTAASASSVVNRAPILAARSRSVTFRSSMEVLDGGTVVRDFSERGEIDFSTGSYRTVLRLAGSGTLGERRRVGANLYFATSAHQSAHGHRWTAVHLSPAQRASVAAAPGVDTFTDPFALLQVLAVTRAPAIPAGPATVDGISTMRYRVSSDLATVRRASTPIADQPAAYAHVQADIEVWLDQQGRPRQISERFHGGPAAPGDSLRTVTTFSGYGQPVRIRAPAGVQVSPAPPSGGPTAVAAAPSNFYERLLFGVR